MSFVKQSNANAAAVIISRLQKRNMEGYFCETSKEAVEKALSLMPEGSVISWGGSMSLGQCGLMDAVKEKNYTLIDRMAATTPREKREVYARTVMADYYLMSTNAITMDGELVNIDGNGNRLACLMQGPSHVCLVVGRNKVSTTLEDAIHRVRNIAAPANVKRLHKQTPCGAGGRCGDCFSPD